MALLLSRSFFKMLPHSPHPSAGPVPTSPLAASSWAQQMTGAGLHIGCVPREAGAGVLCCQKITKQMRVAWMLVVLFEKLKGLLVGVQAFLEGDFRYLSNLKILCSRKIPSSLTKLYIKSICESSNTRPHTQSASTVHYFVNGSSISNSYCYKLYSDF